ncbi:hypothetical protein AGR1_10770 [Agrobacterium sp. B1(2019)]|nr:hypothetical protein AGR1_10770 [Agrobacterium sp. B1(2019)]
MFRCLRSDAFCRISGRKTGTHFSWKCSKPFGGTTVILATLPVSSTFPGQITPCNPPHIDPTLGVQTCAKMKAGSISKPAPLHPLAATPARSVT